MEAFYEAINASPAVEALVNISTLAVFAAGFWRLFRFGKLLSLLWHKGLLPGLEYLAEQARREAGFASADATYLAARITHRWCDIAVSILTLFPAVIIFAVAAAAAVILRNESVMSLAELLFIPVALFSLIVVVQLSTLRNFVRRVEKKRLEIERTRRSQAAQ
ncbi:MAG TPA: hypothetical protein VFZ91_12455 [Allosphingosinicella sp.]